MLLLEQRVCGEDEDQRKARRKAEQEVVYQRATESPAEVREPLQQQLVTVSAGPLGIGLKDKQAGGPV